MLNDDEPLELDRAMDPEGASRLGHVQNEGLRDDAHSFANIRLHRDGKNAEPVLAGPSSRLMVPTSDGNLYLPCDTILRLKADGSYTYVYTHNGERLFTCKGIGLLHKQLPAAWFYRCHHASVINLLKVRKLICHGGHRAELFTGDVVEVSRRKWGELLKAMSSLSGR
jgi:DNA-binding LytR/AlgR family response regulator